MKDHRYKFHPNGKIILGLREGPKSLRTRYQVQKQTQIRRNQKVIKIDNDELIVKKYPKTKQPNNQQPIYRPPIFPGCKQKNWLEFDKGYYCKNCESIAIKQKHKVDEKVRRQDQYFSTTLPYAYKSNREIWMNMNNTTFITTEDTINKLQLFKNKTKLKFHQNISNYYDETNYRKHNYNFQFEEDPFSKNAGEIIKIYQEVLLILKLLQTKPQVKKMNIKYYDLYCTVIKNGDHKENVIDEYENIENDYINCNHFRTPTHYFGRKNDTEE